LPGPTVLPVQTALDPHTIRGDFPILRETINGRRLIWFDNAATTQKPRCVIERLRHFYEHENSNVHRTAHTLAARRRKATSARGKRRGVAPRRQPGEIVFVRGTTEAINLVAQSYGMETLSEGMWLSSPFWTHANIIPWQLVCQATGPCCGSYGDESGRILLDEYRKILNKKTKSYRLRTCPTRSARLRRRRNGSPGARYGAKVLVDGAQAAAHMKVDVQALDCDFYAFSVISSTAPRESASYTATTPGWRACGPIREAAI
jgi:cysteine desulfurase/selenocysteine lyase